MPTFAYELNITGSFICIGEDGRVLKAQPVQGQLPLDDEGLKNFCKQMQEGQVQFCAQNNIPVGTSPALAPMNGKTDLPVAEITGEPVILHKHEYQGGTSNS